MRRNSLVWALVLAVCSAAIAAAPASAVEPDSGVWELGVILGEPTGLSAKYWTSRTNAIDFGTAWSFRDDGYFHFHCDYLYHNYEVFKVDEGSLPLYFGIGGRVGFADDDARLGLRLVLGIEYLADAYPMSVFFEVAPIIDFSPDTDADINGGLGIRYVF